MDRQESYAVLLSATPERVADISLLVNELLIQRNCPSGTAATLRGRLLHIAASRAGKTASTFWTMGLEFDLHFILSALQQIRPRVFPLSPSVESTTFGWTDAAFSVSADGPSLTLCAVIANGSSKWG